MLSKLWGGVGMAPVAFCANRGFAVGISRLSRQVVADLSMAILRAQAHIEDAGILKQDQGYAQHTHTHTNTETHAYTHTASPDGIFQFVAFARSRID